MTSYVSYTLAMNHGLNILEMHDDGKIKDIRNIHKVSHTIVLAFLAYLRITSLSPASKVSSYQCYERFYRT